MANDKFIPTYSSCQEVSKLCPVEATIYGGALSQAAAVFFGIAFFICLLAQIYFGVRARTWSFSIWLALGTTFEVVGYLARFTLARNPWSLNSFIIQYIALLLAPTLVAAAISVTFKSVVIWYGKQWSVIRPALYPWVFVGTDFLSILIQVLGGGATATATTGNAGEGVRKLGEGLVIGGVSFQVANMLCCGSLMLTYVKRRKAAMRGGLELLEEGQRNPSPLGTDKRSPIAVSRAAASVKEGRRTRKFVYALGIAYVAIIIRCTYRIAETVPAISRDILRNEALFLALDGAMLLLAIGLVTFVHPYHFFPYLGVKRKMRKELEQSDTMNLMDSQHQQQRPYL